MNHKQISDLQVGDRLEFKEDYEYKVGFLPKSPVIKKGTIMTLRNPFLGGWRFDFDTEQEGFISWRVGFGRSRLLKIRVKKVE